MVFDKTGTLTVESFCHGKGILWRECGRGSFCLPVEKESDHPL